MDLKDKILNLFNGHAWLENFIGKVLMTKAVKHAVAAMVGVLGSLTFTMKVKPWLDHFGVTIDPVHLAEGLTVTLTGLTGSLMNWAVKVMYKDETPKT